MDGSVNSRTICDLIYTPLDRSKREIRLISILPSADPQDDLCCELFTASLDAKPRYNALSYVWGYSGDTVTINLNDHQFALTRNLAAALRSLRSPYHEVRIWVDAVCIYQADGEERMHQVELMRDIYRSTRRTFLWLGDLDESSIIHYSRDCFTWSGDESDDLQVAYMLNHKKPTFEFMFCMLSLLARQNMHLSAFEPEAVFFLLSALHRLGLYTWWNRIWVVQEAILPDEVTICLGPFRAPLKMLSQAVYNIQKHAVTCCDEEIIHLRRELKDSLTRVSRELTAMADIDTMIRSNRKLTLPSLLIRFCTRQSADPRDIIYGMLGLVTDWGRVEPITPDYSKTLEGLFEEVSYRFIQNSFDVMSFAGLIHLPFEPFDKRIQEWPSWAVDWRSVHSSCHGNLAREVLDRYRLYNASGGISAKPVLHKLGSDLNERHVLSVPGVYIGKIEITASINHSTACSLQELIKMIPGRLQLQHATNYITGETVPEALSRTLYWDSIPTDPKAAESINGSSVRRIFPADLEALRREIGGEISWYNDIHTLFPSDRKAELLDKETHFFRTDSDYVGCIQTHNPQGRSKARVLMGSPLAFEVFVISGSRVPYILEAIDETAIDGVEGKRCYQLVSDCYVHGIMDAEMFQNETAVETQEIWLI